MEAPEPTVAPLSTIVPQEFVAPPKESVPPQQPKKEEHVPKETMPEKTSTSIEKETKEPPEVEPSKEKPPKPPTDTAKKQVSSSSEQKAPPTEEKEPPVEEVVEGEIPPDASMSTGSATERLASPRPDDWQGPFTFSEKEAEALRGRHTRGAMKRQREEEPILRKRFRGHRVIGTFFYVPGRTFASLMKAVGELVRIQIAARHMTIANSQVAGNMLWGDDVYTDDSDIVAMLMHKGFIPYSSVARAHGCEVILRVYPRQKQYINVRRNGIYSKFWKSHEGASLRIERVERVLPRVTTSMLLPVDRKELARMHLRPKPPLSRTTVDPAMPSVVFNMTNEPSFVYTLELLKDGGVSPDLWTSNKLNTNVLYVETENERFELSRDGEKYQWARVVHRRTAKGSHVPVRDGQVVFKGIRWSDFVWNPRGVQVNDKVYVLKTLFWREKQ